MWKGKNLVCCAAFVAAVSLQKAGQSSENRVQQPLFRVSAQLIELREQSGLRLMNVTPSRGSGDWFHSAA